MEKNYKVEQEWKNKYCPADFLYTIHLDTVKLYTKFEEAGRNRS